MQADRSTLASPTIVLCFVAAMIEGADIVSMGLAAPAVARQFGFQPDQMSYILTAAIVGLMAGAAFGGALGDRLGRKRVLVISFAILALFSLLTTHAASFDSFVIIRLCCGLGLGAAFPNLIALATEAAPPGRQATGVGLMFCGQPLGGALLGLFTANLGEAADWREIFYVGGALPSLALPLLMLALPESSTFQRARPNVSDSTKSMTVSAALFGSGRGVATVLLWLSHALSQLLVYLINNWLPTLMVAKGFTSQQAGLIAACENFGAAAGCVILAVLADRGYVRRVIFVTYLAIALSLAALATANGFAASIAAGSIVGFFTIGGQLVLYALAPRYYPTPVRATGVGSAVAFGRLGGISGPIAAGQLLALGAGPAGVLLTAVPCGLLAGAAALSLVCARRPSDH